MHNLDGVIIGKATTFDLEEEPLDDPARCAIDAFPVEYDSLMHAQMKAARAEALPQGNAGRKRL